MIEPFDMILRSTIHISWENPGSATNRLLMPTSAGHDRSAPVSTESMDDLWRSSQIAEDSACCDSRVALQMAKRHAVTGETQSRPIEQDLNTHRCTI